jgi:ABC-type polysaccharide/polyol phosphate transport system ATPase subunit
MSLAIQIRGVGKRYLVSHQHARRSYRTLRESLMETAAASWAAVSTGSRAAREEFWALDDVSFDVHVGQVVGLIGANGAGKSTLLKILSRITRPTRGKIDLYGRVASLLEVGTGFHPELTGRENIFLSGSILGMSRREINRRFDEIVAFAEIEQFLDTPVKHYSSGMYVRLAFAVAAHLEPEILIIDEVLAVGDAAFQRKCIERMESIGRDGRTILVVSHNMGSIARLCNTAVLLAGGTVAHQGPVDGCIARYFASSKERITAAVNGVSLRLAISGRGGERLDTWKRDQDLVATVEIGCADSRSRAVDLAFYSDEGVRLFALQSDRMTPPAAVSAGGTTVFRFCITNPGLNCSSLGLDVGVRLGGSRDYAALWERAATIAVSRADLPAYAVAGTLLCPPARLESGRANPC